MGTRLIWRSNWWKVFIHLLLVAILVKELHWREYNSFFLAQNAAASEEFVKECPVCQKNKSENVPYPGLLQPLPILEMAWSHISMDFIEGLPRSGGKNCILVVVDKFSKFSHFIPLSHPFTAAVIAKTFMQHVYRLHGLPQSIVSDRDKVFTSQFWQELFKLAKVQLRMSSA